MRSRKSLIKEADRVFSIYVRRRGETFGYNHCYTCGKYLPFDYLQAGHFIPRRFTNVRWHPLNVWPQCNKCNVEKHGNLVVYEQKLNAMFDPLAIEALWDLAYTNDGLTDYEIKKVIDTYKAYAV